jgi:hypothetical protein
VAPISPTAAFSGKGEVRITFTVAPGGVTTARAFTAPCGRLADAGLYSAGSQFSSVTLAVSGTRIVVTVAADEGNEVLQPARPARAVFRPVLRTAPAGRRAAAIPGLQATRAPPARASPSPAAAAPDQDISRQS